MGESRHKKHTLDARNEYCLSTHILGSVFALLDTWALALFLTLHLSLSLVLRPFLKLFHVVLKPRALIRWPNENVVHFGSILFRSLVLLQFNSFSNERGARIDQTNE